MTAPTQAETINPLHLWGNLSQAAQAQVLSHIHPGLATMLGASGAETLLSYDATDLLQTFSPVISAAGLNAAQQEDLTATLETAGTGAPGANNTLLTSGGASQVIANVLVGDANAAAAEVSPANPGLYNEQGVIEGVPSNGVSQASDAVTGALLNLGASGVAASPVNPVSANGVDEKQFTAAAGVVANNIPVGSLNLTAAEQVAMAEYAVVMESPSSAHAAAAVAEGVVTETAPAAGNMPMTNFNLTTAEQAAIVEYAAALANPERATTVAAVAAKIVTEAAPAARNVSAENLKLTTAEQVAMAEYAAVMANPAAAIVSAVNAGTAITAVIGEAAITTDAVAATNSITAAAIAATPVRVAATTVAATQSLQNLPATNEIQHPESLPMAKMNVVAMNAATTAIAAPAATESGAVAEVVILPAIVSTVASTTPTVTTATANTIPVIKFDNASSVLQSLIAEAIAHAMIQGGTASATYSVGGAMFQMGTGADHVQQYTINDYQPDIPDIVRPVSPIARVRGVTERQT